MVLIGRFGGRAPKNATETLKVCTNVESAAGSRAPEQRIEVVVNAWDMAAEGWQDDASEPIERTQS